MAGLTRGALPAEVYWRRRLLVLAVALLLVLGLSRVLGGGSDASDGAATGGSGGSGGTAAQAGADTSTTPVPSGATEPAAPSATPTTKKERRQARRAAKAAAAAAEASAAAAAAAQAAAALPDPEGPCADTDVVITPTVPAPVGGSDVAIDLELRTAFSPACSWKVSPETLAVKVTSGKETYWSTQACPKAIPTQDVVLRRASPTTIQVVWNAKRVDSSCKPLAYALPDAYYHVYAAPLAGEPTDVQFELTAPAPQTVLETISPEAAAKAAQKAAKKANQKANEKAQQR